MTHRERLLKIMKGEMVDKLPWAPRIDLWHNANKIAGTLPNRHSNRSLNEIYLAEGWPLHKVSAEYSKPEKPDDMVHQGIGLYRLKEVPYDFQFSSDVTYEVVKEENDEETLYHVKYYTSEGSIAVTSGHTNKMRLSGVSTPWIKEHAIKTVSEYAVLTKIFGGIKLRPSFDRFLKWKREVGENGIAVAQGIGIACSSPYHFIQKTLIDPTLFYLHYNDYRKDMDALAEAIGGVYEQLIGILSKCPCDAVLWSANVDAMITPPPFYKKEILPWCIKASEKLHQNGILSMIHPDGENKGLIELISESGMDVADAVTPFPMTKVTIGEYYERWCRSGKLTIQGGIPECLLLEKSSTWQDLKGYMDGMLEAVIPGKRFIAAIGDTTPPGAEFSRLLYIGEVIEKKGNLPLKAGSANPKTEAQMQKAASMLTEGHSIHADISEKYMNSPEIIFEIGISATVIGNELLRFGKALKASQEIGTPKESEGKNKKDITHERYKATDDIDKDNGKENREIESTKTENKFRFVQDDVLSGNHKDIITHVKELLEKGYKAYEILNYGMITAMEKIGDKFRDGTVFIPEVLLSGRAMNEAVNYLEPYFGEDLEKKEKKKIMMGTVYGDMHDIGKNLVITMLRGVGYEVVDLGINVKAEGFLHKVKEENPDVLGMSALLTSTMSEMKSVIKLLEDHKLRSGLRIIVGGAPVNQKYADEIGADGYAQNAGEAVTLLNKLFDKT